MSVAEIVEALGTPIPAKSYSPAHQKLINHFMHERFKDWESLEATQRAELKAQGAPDDLIETLVQTSKEIATSEEMVLVMYSCTFAKVNDDTVNLYLEFTQSSFYEPIRTALLLGQQFQMEMRSVMIDKVIMPIIEDYLEANPDVILG